MGLHHSLQERNQLVVAAAQAEETERQHLQEELGQVEKHLSTLLPRLDVCSDPNHTQVCCFLNALKTHFD